MDSSTSQRLAAYLREHSNDLGKLWLDRVHELITVARLDVFPSPHLLDHIPAVLCDVADHIEAPHGTDLESNTELLARAAALGELRHKQHASVHQILREYRILAELLEDAMARHVTEIADADPGAVALAIRRLNEAVRLIQQHTLDTFVATYTRTLERQTTQLRKFSRLVSHEIRQPLGVLQVIARAIPVRTDDVEAARIMAIFERSVARLAEVTGKLERLARMSRATDLFPSERSVDLNEVAHEAAAQLADAARDRDVDIRVHPHLPVLRLDPVRAELIFVNLIANAIKFADPGKPYRYVEIAPGGGDQPSVLVRDNGVGMAPPRLQNIFREFVRAHGQRDEEVPVRGLGLGLSIVRECMDHANGSVRVDSIEGRGTTFKLTWSAH